MSRSFTVKSDAKGRVAVPRVVRGELGIEPGTTFAVRREGNTIIFVKMENPFDGLARHAIEEYRAGRTRSLEEIARDLDIELEAE